MVLIVFMAEKQRYTVSLPDHVSAEMERHAKAVKSTPTEYAADIIRWWFGQGCPPVRHDETELRKRTIDEMMKRIKPVPDNFDIWKLNPNVDYNLVDEPVKQALSQLGLPNLFAHAQEHEAIRLTVAFDNHPSHWLVFNFFKGSNNPDGDGLSLYGFAKATFGRKQIEKKLIQIAREMESKDPIKFSQIPSLKRLEANSAEAIRK
jgi:hypothetical protein